MTYARSTICIYPTCTTRASFGVRGSRPEFCTRHAPSHYVNLKVPRCEIPSCGEYATHCAIIDGCKMRPSFCAAHAPLRCVSVTRALCTVPHCEHIAQYGERGSHRPTHCASHAPATYTIECSTKCRATGCDARVPGAGICPAFCPAHESHETPRSPRGVRKHHRYAAQSAALAAIASSARTIPEAKRSTDDIKDASYGDLALRQTMCYKWVVKGARARASRPHFRLRELKFEPYAPTYDEYMRELGIE